MKGERGQIGGKEGREREQGDGRGIELAIYLFFFRAHYLIPQ